MPLYHVSTYYFNWIYSRSLGQQPKPAVPKTVTSSKSKESKKDSSLADIQAKLHQANEQKDVSGNEMTTLQQEEEVSISGSNARLMVMQKLSRKTDVRKYKMYC